MGLESKEKVKPLSPCAENGDAATPGIRVKVKVDPRAAYDVATPARETARTRA